MMSGFDAYVLRLGKISGGLSILCVVIAFLYECGGLGGGLLAGLHVLLLVALLGVPQLVFRLKGLSLATESSNQALLAWLALGGSLVITLLFGRDSGGCFR